MPDSPTDVLLSAAQPCFATTHWSVVLDAGCGSSPQALEQLCRTYWPPLYAYLRRKGHGPHDAEDLTQGFFTRSLEKHFLDQVSREKGKFRTFLLCALNHYLANEWDKANRLKRGGGMRMLPLDTEFAEDRYSAELHAEETAEIVFDKRWAQTLLDVVLRRLRLEHRETGKEQRFGELKPFLMGNGDAEQYRIVARRLEMTEQGVKSAVHRLRRRFRELFREEIAHTVPTREGIDEELRYLVRLMTS